MRKLSEKKVGLFKKTQTILTHCKQRGLHERAEPWDAMSLLQQIRNAVVHFKPEWSHEIDKHGDITAAIVSRDLPLSPFACDRKSAFPRGCMSAGCADWAVST